MTQRKQLSFNFGPHMIFPSLEVQDRVRRHSRHWAGMRVKRHDLENVLDEPDRFWRMCTKKQGGKKRTFYIPEESLANIQRRLARHIAPHNISRMIEIGSAPFSTAYRRRSSVRHNAWAHQHNRSSLRLDLENAFETVERKHVYRFLLRFFEPKMLRLLVKQREQWSFRNGVGVWRTDRWIKVYQEQDAADQILARASARDLAWIYARIFTYKGRLRLGPPSSPEVFNAMLERMDAEIARVIEAYPDPQSLSYHNRRGRRYGISPSKLPRQVVYTRYADDLCFSSPEETFPQELEERIRGVITEHGFAVNERKVRYAGHGVLTFPGVIIVNGEVRPERKYVEEVERKLPTMTAAVARGHAANLAQFKGGKTRKLVKRLNAHLEMIRTGRGTDVPR